MPPPPPRLVTTEEAAVGSSGTGGSLDSLARLYETAKQLDDRLLPGLLRRERSVSDAEATATTTISEQQEASFYDVRRERSASCGTAPVARKTNTSPSAMMCETILEEEPVVKGLAEELMDHLAR